MRTGINKPWLERLNSSQGLFEGCNFGKTKTKKRVAQRGCVPTGGKVEINTSYLYTRDMKTIEVTNAQFETLELLRREHQITLRGALDLALQKVVDKKKVTALKTDAEVLSPTALRRSKARLKSSQSDKRYSLAQTRKALGLV